MWIKFFPSLLHLREKKGKKVCKSCSFLPRFSEVNIKILSSFCSSSTHTQVVYVEHTNTGGKMEESNESENVSSLFLFMSPLFVCLLFFRNFLRIMNEWTEFSDSPFYRRMNVNRNSAEANMNSVGTERLATK